MYAVQIQYRESRKLPTSGQDPLYILAETIQGFIYIEFYHRVNTHGKNADGLYNFMIDNKDGQIPSPLLMFTHSTLSHALLEWQKNIGIHLKGSKPKLKAQRLDCYNYFNNKNDGGKNASCCTAMSRKLSTLPGAADTYLLLMNTWNTLPECYQQRVYKHTFATVKRQIQEAENQIPAMVIRVEAWRVHNPILADYLISEVVLEEPEIRSTDQDIAIGNNCMEEELDPGISWGSGDSEDQGDETYKCNTIPTASPQWRATTQLERLDLGTTDVDAYKGNTGDDADAHEDEHASQADDESTQNLEDWGHSMWQRKGWTVYFRPVKYDNGEANEGASNVSKATSVL